MNSDRTGLASTLNNARYYLDAYVWRRTIAEQAARAAAKSGTTVAFFDARRLRRFCE
jgi:hypothetical protein